MRHGFTGVLTGLLLGVGGTFGVLALTDSSDAPNSHATMSMMDMNRELENLSGDAFDQAFIEMMIVHHEGAIAMAELSPSRARHSEIKTLSEEIIEAQTEEIRAMWQWLADWGYEPNASVNWMHGSH